MSQAFISVTLPLIIEEKKGFTKNIRRKTKIVEVQNKPKRDF